MGCRKLTYWSENSRYKIVSINEWNHLVGMRDGDTIRFFKNGILEGSTYIGGVSVNNVGRDILIGKILSGQHANAIFDDFAYYQKALTQEQVKALYGAGCDFYTPQLAYRYGFQGQEKDDEIKGEGNSVNYKYRMHDPRVGRFFAVDPLAPKYPHYSPYMFSGNNVIHAVELEGLEPSFLTVVDERTGSTERQEQVDEGGIDNYFNYDGRDIPEGTMISDYDDFVVVSQKVCPS